MDKKPRISAIAAIGAKTRALGKNNDLIWKIPDDLKRLKSLTVGHPIIMGRKTYESIGRPLPNRTNIVITRDTNWNAPGITITHSLDEAINETYRADGEEIFIFGGAEIYKQALAQTDRLYLTLIESDETGDVFFPPYENEFTHVVSKEERKWDNISYNWVTLERA